jgi:hypothetical protein
MITHKNNMEKEYKNEIEELNQDVTPIPDIKLRTITGFFETVTAVPTMIPTSFRDQIKWYVNGGTKRLYIYDTTNNSWEYVINYIHP